MGVYIKFNEPIFDYEYILAFDLASHITGWSLIKVDWKKNKKISYTCISSGVLDFGNVKDDLYYTNQVNAMREVIAKCKQLSDYNLFITKERLPNQAGGRSTIAALQALAQTHAIFQYVLEESGVDSYDYDGIHSISARSYFKELTGLDKPSKEDMRMKICEMVQGVSPDTDLNITDSIAVTVTLVDRRWNADICDEIRAVKRDIKKFKSEKKLKELKDRITFLGGLKVCDQS